MQAKPDAGFALSLKKGMGEWRELPQLPVPRRDKAGCLHPSFVCGIGSKCGDMMTSLQLAVGGCGSWLDVTPEALLPGLSLYSITLLKPSKVMVITVANCIN